MQPYDHEFSLDNSLDEKWNHVWKAAMDEYLKEIIAYANSTFDCGKCH